MGKWTGGLDICPMNFHLKFQLICYSMTGEILITFYNVNLANQAYKVYQFTIVSKKSFSLIMSKNCDIKFLLLISTFIVLSLSVHGCTIVDLTEPSFILHCI